MQEYRRIPYNAPEVKYNLPNTFNDLDYGDIYGIFEECKKYTDGCISIKSVNPCVPVSVRIDNNMISVVFASRHCYQITLHQGVYTSYYFKLDPFSIKEDSVNRDNFYMFFMIHKNPTVKKHIHSQFPTISSDKLLGQFNHDLYNCDNKIPNKPYFIHGLPDLFSDLDYGDVYGIIEKCMEYDYGIILIKNVNPCVPCMINIRNGRVSLCFDSLFCNEMVYDNSKFKVYYWHQTEKTYDFHTITREEFSTLYFNIY